MADEMKEMFPPAGNTPDEKQAVATAVFDVLGEVIKDKVSLGLHKKWSRCYEMVHGKHWKNKSTVPLVSANLCYRHVQQTVNQLTDNNPTFNISRSGDPNQTKDIYENLQRAATHWWADQEQQDVLESSVRNGETYGVCIEKVIFNKELEGGIGEVETVIVDPFYFGWFPVKIKDPRDIQKADALLHYYPMTVREARRLWPGAEIKGDQTILKDLEDERRNINSEMGSKPRSMMVSLATAAKEILNWATGTTADGEELVVVECWCKDYTMVNDGDPVEGPDGSIIQNQKPKYPGAIRYIVACNGKTILEDRSNPNVSDALPEEQAKMTYLYDKFPFCAVNSVRDTANGWGQSDVEQLEWLNMELNKALSQLVLEKDRAVRRKWVNPKNSGIPNEHFTNFHSILNPVDEKVGEGIRVLEYPAIPVDIQNAITLFKDMFFLISATFEVDQAQLGSNQLAYKSIAALIERVATMMRGKIRSYGRLVRERGRMYLSHVMNFYSEERWINYEDEQGVQTSGSIVGTNLIVPAKLTVVTGSTLPTSKVQQREEALTLFDKHAIDQQELLSALEWSGRADVIKRMMKGPLGAIMDNLASIGMPPEVVQFLSQVGGMDPKDLAKGLKDGSIPPFQAIMNHLLQAAQQAAGQPPPAPALTPLDQAKIALDQAETQVKEATARKIIAETEKVVADQGLIMEKINTEKIDQEVKVKGIEFDEGKLTMDKATTVANITKAAKEANSVALERPKVTGSTPGAPTTTAPAPPPVPDATAKPAGFNEVGMKSDNIGG
jgi:hypothetical protein